MRATRRFWVSGGIGASLIALGVVLARPALALGGLAVGGWLLAHQLAFVLRTRAILEGVTISQTVTPTKTVESQPVRLRTTVTTRSDPGPLDTVTVETPPGTTAESATSSRVTDGETVVDGVLRPTVAGRYAIAPPALTFRDGTGLFAETVQRGEAATLRVEPNAPRNVHVGTGGQRFAVGIGEHDAGEGQGGIEPGELREYLPGDPRDRIDWKATARRGEPHVREFDATTDRQTLLVVDHSASTGNGRRGRRRLDFLREVALWLLERARDADDPVGLVTVGDDGITGRFAPAAGTDHYRRLELALYDLEPTSARRATTAIREQARSRTTADRLDDDSAFARTLRPFLEHASTYVDRVGDAALFSAVEATLGTTAGDPWTVVLTDDDERPQLLETVQFVRRHGGTCTTFVTPGMLFDPRDLREAETVYEEYLAFESFRRRLAGPDRAAAYEVAPEETIRTVLRQRPEARR